MDSRGSLGTAEMASRLQNANQLLEPDRKEEIALQSFERAQTAAPLYDANSRSAGEGAVTSYPSVQNIHNIDGNIVPTLEERLLVQKEAHIHSQGSSIDRVHGDNRNLSLIDQELPEPNPGDEVNTSLV